MKARPFLTVVLAIVVSLMTLAAGGWWWVLSHSPLQLQHQRLVMPLAARFVPRQAPLSLYVFSDGRQLEDYARAVAPSRQRRQAAEAVARLRDGAFAAAGLDYRSELATWLGPETGLALLADRPGAAPNGWVLSLRSRDSDGARRFLQRFWQTRSLAGTDLQVTSYRGMGLISGRGALVGEPSAPLATALINDDLVLIASGRGVLEQALDVSQIDDLNQAASPALQASLAQLGEGVALLTLRPEALSQWQLLPPGLTHLEAALRPDAAGLVLDARVALADPVALPTTATDAGLLQGLHVDADSVAVLQAPAAWPAVLQQLLQPVMAQQASAMPALVVEASDGPLLWAQGASGWLLGTGAGHPQPAALQEQLQGRGLVEAQLDLKGQPVQVWTRLQAAVAKAKGGKGGKGTVGGDSQLQASLEGAHTLAKGQNPLWWAQSLALLEQQLDQRQGPRQRLAELDALEAPAALLRWSLAAAPAQQLLQRWQPWQVLTGLAAQPLAGAVDGLALAVEPSGEQLHLNARLRFD